MMITATIILLAIVAPSIAGPIPTSNTRSISRPRNSNGTPSAVGLFSRATRGGAKKRNIARKRAAETAIAARKAAIVPVTSKTVVARGKLDRILQNKRRSDDEGDEDEDEDEDEDDEGEAEEGDDEEGDDEDDAEEDDEEADEEGDDEDDAEKDDEDDAEEDDEEADGEDGEDEEDDAADDADDGEDEDEDEGDEDDKDGGDEEGASVVEVRNVDKQVKRKPNRRGVSAFNHRKRYVIDELD